MDGERYTRKQRREQHAPQHRDQRVQSIAREREHQDADERAMIASTANADALTLAVAQAIMRDETGCSRHGSANVTSTIGARARWTAPISIP